MNPTQLSILAIDDDKTDASLIERHLKRIDDWELDFAVCQSAAAALAQLSRQQPDVILLDYQLGSETGLTVLRAIRDAGYECPVVLLTGLGNEQLAVEALQSGAADYLAKSQMSEASLRRTISNAIEKSQLQTLIDTHRKNLERTNGDLARRNSEIEGFYHTLSHELKTPLTSLQEFLSIVLDELAGPLTSNQREYLEIAKDSCLQMGKCIDDMLDVTRLETGKFRVELEPRSIDEIIRRVSLSMEGTATDRELDLRVKLEPDLPTVEVDADRIAQILRNLISNAMKFTPKGGSVTVRARPDPNDPDFVMVSVVDTGTGIPPGELERIFEKLYQVTTDSRSTARGLGLGLAISRELVELHGGRISVESEVSRGSSFSFTVRRHSAQPAVASV